MVEALTGRIRQPAVDLQGSYTKRKIFEVICGSPDTDLTGAMLSLRYYRTIVLYLAYPRALFRFQGEPTDGRFQRHQFDPA